MDRDRFDKFTERARRVLSLAQEEAQRFQHNYIGTEHLLLGLVREGEGVAAQVLRNLGVELNKVRSAVEFIVGRGDRIVLGESGLTPRAKKVIELAVDEARRLNHHSIGTEHLLLGLAREEDGIAAGVLESLGVRLEQVRAETLRVLGEEGGQQQNQDDRDRFEKFTERARKVLNLAQEEAKRFQHDYIGTEHLLLGLVREREGVAVKVLSNLGVDLNLLRSTIEFMIGRGDRIVLGEIGLTPGAKEVIELAVDEAHRLNNYHSIGTEHLLLGLVREGEGIAAQALERLGVNLAKVRTHTIQVLSQSGAPHVVSRSRFAQTYFIQSVMEVGEEWFDTFTVQLSRVLSRAEEEAQRFHHNYIGAEHLMLALTRERKGVAARVLSNLGVELDKVRSAVEFSSSDQAQIVPAGLTAREVELLRLVEQGLTEAQIAAKLAISPLTVNRHLTSLYSKLGVTARNATTRYVIELAVDEARLLNHHYVGIEHLLLGLLGEEKGTAAGVLESLGVTLEQVRIETMRVLSQPGLLQKIEVPPQLKAAIQALEAILREKEAAIQRQEYELVAELREREVKQRDLIARLESEWYRERDNKESGQQPIQDDEDKVQELSQEEKDFLQTLGNLSQDERDRFATFTVRARRVLRFSREEAERFQHGYIGTEHLLLGLVRENGSIAAVVLRNLGVDLPRVRDAVEFIIGRGDRIVLGKIGLTPRTKKVLELAADEARRLNHDSIGTGHLLLGLVREGEGIAAGVLESLGVHLEKVRTETTRLLNQQKDS